MKLRLLTDSLWVLSSFSIRHAIGAPPRSTLSSPALRQVSSLSFSSQKTDVQRSVLILQHYLIDGVFLAVFLLNIVCNNVLKHSKIWKRNTNVGTYIAKAGSFKLQLPTITGWLRQSNAVGEGHQYSTRRENADNVFSLQDADVSYSRKKK